MGFDFLSYQCVEISFRLFKNQLRIKNVNVKAEKLNVIFPSLRNQALDIIREKIKCFQIVQQLTQCIIENLSTRRKG